MKSGMISIVFILILNCSGSPDKKCIGAQTAGNILKNEKMFSLKIARRILLQTFSLGSDLYSGSTHSEYSKTLHFDTGGAVYRVTESLSGSLRNDRTGKVEGMILYSLKTGTYGCVTQNIHIVLGNEYTFTVHLDSRGRFLRISGIERKTIKENYTMNLLSFIHKGKKGFGLRNAGLRKKLSTETASQYYLWVKREKSSIAQIKKYLTRVKQQ